MMVKHAPSGLALIAQKNSLWRNRTNAQFTQQFIRKLEGEWLEGKEPPEKPITIANYNGMSYTLDKTWKIRGLNGEVMQYLFCPNKRGPRVRIHRNVKRWDLIVNEEKELNVLSLMKKHFWPYLSGYGEAKYHLDDYLLLPKDDNYENLHRSNLIFVSKKDYLEQWSKRAVIKMYLRNCPTATDQEIAQKTWFSRPHIYRVRQELIQEGILEPKTRLEQLRQLTGIEITEKTLPIYDFFFTNGGDTPNLEIAKQLFPDQYAEAQTNAHKKALTADIVRVRKKLQERGLLAVPALQQYRDEIIELLKNKSETWLTNATIAEKFGLKKAQIDNLSRQLKK